MPRKTPPRLKIRGYRPLPDGPIQRRIKRIIPKIAKALMRDNACVKETIGRFKQLNIDEEILVLLHRCHLHLRTTDSAASVAVQKANIVTLLGLKRPLKDRDYRDLDGASQIRIGVHLQGGLLSADVVNLNDTDLRQAASTALDSLGEPSPGRPPNTDSLARRQLALGLAEIFRTATGRDPGRSYAVEPGPKAKRSNSGEQGDFLEFIIVIVTALPRALHRRMNPVQLARTGVELFKRHPDGLIDEAKFLG